MVAKVFKSRQIHSWINYSWLAVSISTVCLTGPVVRIVLVSRNCVLGRLLNSALGAEARQGWRYGNNYKPSLLSPFLIPVQYTALLDSVCISLTQGGQESTTSLIRLQASQRNGKSSRVYWKPWTLIIPRRWTNGHSLSFIQNKALHLTHWMRKLCSGFFSTRVSTLLHFTSFPLPSVILCHHALAATLHGKTLTANRHKTKHSCFTVCVTHSKESWFYSQCIATIFYTILNKAWHLYFTAKRPLSQCALVPQQSLLQSWQIVEQHSLFLLWSRKLHHNFHQTSN